MMMLISTQRYLDADIVAAKRTQSEYEVQIVRLTIDGVEYGYVIDGHHSHAAAVEQGAPIEIDDATAEYQHEIDYLGFDGFIQAHHQGDDIFDLATGNDLF